MRTRIRVPGMCCESEARLIRGKLGEVTGIESLDIRVIDQRVLIDHDPAQLQPADLATAIRELGLTAHLEAEVVVQTPWERLRPWVWLIAGGLMLGAGLWIMYAQLLSPIAATAIMWVVLAVACWPFVRRALRAMASRLIDMNVLMTIAVIGAGLLGEWVEAAAVAVLFNLAELIESYTLQRARRAIGSLMDLVPKVASVQRGSEWERMPLERVQPGERIRVRPGEQIPLDGRVLEGSSHVDQAPITGESMPASKVPGDEVFAGTLNQTGYLEVRVTHALHETTLSRIVSRIEEAQAKKAPAERMIDRFAAIYTPVVILLAAAVALLLPPLLGWTWAASIYLGLLLLVISCPCALVISTPVAIISALTSAARHGVLIKGGAHLEALGRLRAVALDKTGTLTLGRTRVLGICPAGDGGSDELLRLAAALEQQSEHHLGRAIVAHAAEADVKLPSVDGFGARAGLGVLGVVDGRQVAVGSRRLIEEQVDAGVTETCPHDGGAHTAVCVAADGRYLGTIHIGDAPRPGAAQALHYLKESGIEQTVLLTGDNAATAQKIATALEVDHWQADLLPEDKVSAVRGLTEKHEAVAMVGDGINDAPALAAATVGVAMGTAGSDTALETADVALMADDLDKLSYAIRLGRRARRVIAGNVMLAIGIKIVFLGLAFGGLATLWMAIAADLGASLLVIANGLRLTRGVRDEPCDHKVADPELFAGLEDKEAA